MIEAIELCKQFERSVKKGRRTAKESFLAVDHVSLQAHPGEIIGILGPNGAGKTTLLRMLGMLMTPTSGNVRLTLQYASEPDSSEARVSGHGTSSGSLAQSVSESGACESGFREAEGGGSLNFAKQTDVLIESETAKKASIGYLSGNTKLYPRFSIREYLRFLGELYGLDRKQIKERTAEISRVLDMESFLDNRIEKLSTGQTQRASIARCLMADPQIYILDEPTLGLDILSADAIIHFMKEQKEQGKTVLYSTHYLEEAQFLCDRVYMICDGRIVAQGTPQELLVQTGTKGLREAFHSIYGAQTAGSAGRNAEKPASEGQGGIEKAGKGGASA